MNLKPEISGTFRHKYKRRWEIFGAIIGMGLGYLLYLITLLIPNYSLNYFFEVIPSLFRGIFVSINDLSVNSPYFPIAFFFIAFIGFPSCLGWMVPGAILGYYRNTQFKNVEIKNNGWKIFWNGVYFIEITFVIFTFCYISIYLNQILFGNYTYESLLTFFGSGILMLILFFASPFFWIGLFSAGLGGFIGTKIANKKTAPSELIVKEIDYEDIDENEDMLNKENKITKLDFSFSESIESEKEEGIEFDSQNESLKKRCEYCGHKLPLTSKFCNNCGKRSEGGSER